MKKILITLVTLLILGGQNKLLGQACCTGGAPISTNLGVQNYQANHLVIDVSYDYNSLRDLYAASKNLHDSRRTRTIKTMFLRNSYGINESWSISVILPYLWQEQIVRTDFGRTRQNSEGIGDVVLLALRSLINDNKHQLIIAAGSKLPTGSISKKDDEFGILIAPDLQPGTGSWDGIGALSYSRFGIFTKKTNLFALFSYRYSFEQNRNDGQQKYRFGNELAINLGLNHSFLLKTWSINPSLHYRYRNSQADQNNGFDFPNTGGDWMYIVPGIELNSGKGLIIHSSVEIPIHTDVRGTQLVTSQKWNFGITYPINFKKNKAFKLKYGK